MTEQSPKVTAPIGTDSTDPTYFHMRYPTLHDLLSRGGLEGVEYCLVAGHNLRKFTEEHWSAIKGLPPLTIEGPKGVVDSVVLMGRGDPIPGSDDHNGIRWYYTDIFIEDTTGLPSDPNNQDIDMTNTPKEVITKASNKRPPKEEIQVIEGK